MFSLRQTQCWNRANLNPFYSPQLALPRYPSAILFNYQARFWWCLNETSYTHFLSIWPHIPRTHWLQKLPPPNSQSMMKPAALLQLPIIKLRACLHLPLPVCVHTQMFLFLSGQSPTCVPHPIPSDFLRTKC